uniref:Glycosyltransferase n=1 Tax=candidate division CPR3 bacterium TaxID=2268181 RepID=A0A7C4M012_UNCC3
MRIAIVHNLPSGGMKRAMGEQIKRLSKRHKIDIFTPARFSYKYPTYFPQNIISIYKDLPKVYQAIAHEINENKYDIALVYPCFLTQAPYVFRYLTCRSLYFCPEPKREFYEKIKRVSNQWSYFFTYPFRIPIREIDKFNVKCAGKIVTISKYSKKQIESIYGVYAQINYLAVDTNIFKLTNTKKENMVMTVGDLSLHKGHDFIINSLSKIPYKIRPKFVIVGFGGSEKKYLSALAIKMKVKLTIRENISDKELIDLYNKAKVFLYAAQNEPFGLVLLEASACGLPIIAIDEGGVREIVKSSLIGDLTRRNIEDYSQKIMTYLQTGDKLAKVRHDYIAKNWSWNKSVDQLEKYLTQK